MNSSGSRAGVRFIFGGSREQLVPRVRPLKAETLTLACGCTNRSSFAPTAGALAARPLFLRGDVSALRLNPGAQSPGARWARNGAARGKMPPLAPPSQSLSSSGAPRLAAQTPCQPPQPCPRPVPAAPVVFGLTQQLHGPARTLPALGLLACLALAGGGGAPPRPHACPSPDAGFSAGPVTGTSHVSSVWSRRCLGFWFPLLVPGLLGALTPSCADSRRSAPRVLASSAVLWELEAARILLKGPRGPLRLSRTVAPGGPWRCL